MAPNSSDTNVKKRAGRSGKNLTSANLIPPPPGACPYPSLYFGGCCFGAAFYVGVYKALWELYGPDFMQDMKISGGSAGTIFAIGIALRKSPEYMDALYRKVAARSHASGPVYNPFYHTGASVFMEEGLRDMLDDPLAFKKIEGICYFGTTRFYDKHTWHMSWESNEDLVDCCQSSYHIPFYCHRNKPIKGVEVVDGAYGFSGLDLLHGDDTLYIGIDPHAEITRSFTNNEMFFPAVGKDYDDMVDSGYKAMLKFAVDGEMIKKVGHRIPNYPALKVLWVLKFFEVYFLKGCLVVALIVAIYFYGIPLLLI